MKSVTIVRSHEEEHMAIEDIFPDLAKELKRKQETGTELDLPSDKEDLETRLRRPNLDAIYAQRRRFRDTE